MIKNLAAAFLTTLTLGLIVSATSVAQTKDGYTPSEETICDVLKTDGTTKGLYGLCVAFCEARDVIDGPVTEEELDAIFENLPSPKILEKYNARKKAEDPSMPCVIVAQTCPLWNSAQMNSFDGDTVYGTKTADVICRAYIAERTVDRSQLDADGFIRFDKHPTYEGGLARALVQGRVLSDVATLASEGAVIGEIVELEGPAVDDCQVRYEAALAKQCPVP